LRRDRLGVGIGGHRHRPSCRRCPTSDIDISLSDIGTKYVGLNPHIPISEEFRYRHQLPFQYRTKSISDIPISKIDKSFPNYPTKILLLTTAVGEGCCNGTTPPQRSIPKPLVPPSGDRLKGTTPQHNLAGNGSKSLPCQGNIEIT
jgi:hypothetical protein